ncbi:hypothetical protein FKW77_009542 [Venturia effusa]|uniref:Uncharacterized protein n=1 Tax=Venturia effusa TaxID=50376 RepID=A0A517L043_9PEZI|nr:hypothetical protein FKW77_009542 [Venturia effusa]
MKYKHYDTRASRKRAVETRAMEQPPTPRLNTLNKTQQQQKTKPVAPKPQTSFLDLPSELRQIILRHIHANICQPLHHQIETLTHISAKRPPLSPHPLVVECIRHHGRLPTASKFIQLANILSDYDILGDRIITRFFLWELEAFEQKRRNEETMCLFWQRRDVLRGGLGVLEEVGRVGRRFGWVCEGVERVVPGAVGDWEVVRREEGRRVLGVVRGLVEGLREVGGVDGNLLEAMRGVEGWLEGLEDSG